MSSELSRRDFVAKSLTVLSTATFSAIPYHASAKAPAKKLVAAVQMHAVLGDVEANLENASHWANKAVEQGAEIVVLPEFFASGLGFHPSMMNACRPIDGAPKEMLQAVARQGNAWVGGSFLAESEGHVFNTFMLALPDGRVFTHDKDFPSGVIEQHLYAGGEDREFVRLISSRGRRTSPQVVPSRSTNNQPGVFSIGDTRVGAAMCWELVRKRTDRRLLDGGVDLILAGSGWYALEPESAAAAIGGTQEDWTKTLEQGRENASEAPIRLARMTGAAVVHANLVGDNWSLRFPTGQKEICRRFHGESQIVERDGEVVSRLSGHQGEGIVLGEITPTRTQPQEEIGDGFWHIQMTPQLEDFWYDGFGRDYYQKVTRPQREMITEWRRRG